MKRQHLQTVAGGLSLLFVWACTEVHVRLSHRAPTTTTDESISLQAKEPISIAQLIAQQQQRQQRDKSAQDQSSLPTSLCDAQGTLTGAVRPYNQETSNWCWATSAQTVLEFHQEVRGQCDWVNRALSREDCCGNRTFDTFLNRWFINTPSACDQGGWPHWVFTASGFDYELLMAPGTPDPNEWTTYFEAFQRQLCQNGPFVSVIQWADGGGHTQVVRGIHTDLQVVEVNNHRDADFNTLPFDVFIGDAVGDHYGEYGYAQESFYVEIRRH
ncbi:MAG: putative PeptidaseC392 domain-containing protein [Nitrospira sp.]|nr:MAG: putative PeptidaseC392 domain-containing protein [Nitrospira sp.]